jgi:phage terminase large subunit-like protein
LSAVPDKWIRNKSDEAAVNEDCTFSIDHAERVRDFLYKFCRQSIGVWSGKPLELLEWQWSDLIAPLYSWRRPDGSRRFRSASVWVPKNQGKSTLCSGLSLYHLIADNEPAAQVVNLAATVEQAGIVYRGACDMVSQSPELDKLLWTRKNIKTIEFDRTRSTYKVMSGDRGHGKHGHSISLLIFDELAEQVSRELFDTMRHNLIKRQNSLLISISTAGFRRESIGYEQFMYAEKVLSGEIIDTSFLPVVYTARPEDAWDTLDTFKRCNPSYGHTIQENDYTTLITEARNEPRKEAAYRTLRLDQWTGFSTCWISAPAWEACGDDFKEEDFYGQSAWVGWDYGYKHDLCSYCLLFKRDDKVFIVPRFFIPRKSAEIKQRIDKVPYLTWERQGFIHLTDGDVIDPAFVRQTLAEDAEKFRLMEIGFDPTGLEESRQICEQEHGWTMVSVPQRPRYIGPSAAYFERLVLSGQLRHNRNPIMTWCLGNCATKETSDGLFIFKGQGDSQRIDGAIAAVIGLSRLMVADDQQGEWLLVL